MQVIARPDGKPLWFSRATPGRTHDLTSARAHGIVQACLTRQILVLADRAYQGAGATFRAPYYHHREQSAKVDPDSASRASCSGACKAAQDYGDDFATLGLAQSQRVQVRKAHSRRREDQGSPAERTVRFRR